MLLFLSDILMLRVDSLFIITCNSSIYDVLKSMSVLKFFPFYYKWKTISLKILPSYFIDIVFWNMHLYHFKTCKNFLRKGEGYKQPRPVIAYTSIYLKEYSDIQYQRKMPHSSLDTGIHKSFDIDVLFCRWTIFYFCL